MNYLAHPRTIAKAIWTASTTFLAQCVLIIVGDMTFGDLTTANWLVIALNTIVVTGGVFGLENAPLPLKKEE